MTIFDEWEEKLRSKVWEANGLDIDEFCRLTNSVYSSVNCVSLVENLSYVGLLSFDGKTGKWFPWVNQEDTDFVWKPFPEGVNTVAEFVRYRDKLYAWRKVAKEITHERAKSVLRNMPLEMNFSKMGAQRLGALSHYLSCQECRSLGLAKIRSTKSRSAQLEHKKAILTWGKRANYLPAERPQNLLDVYAEEHLMTCRHLSCMALRSYWDYYRRLGFKEHHLEEAQTHLYPRLIEIFMRSKWQLKELWKLNREHSQELLKGLEKRNQAEMLAILSKLQDVAEMTRRDLISRSRKLKEKK